VGCEHFQSDLENVPDCSESVRNARLLREKKRRRKNAKSRQQHSSDAFAFNFTIDFTRTAINAERSSARATENSSFRKTLGANPHACTGVD
jgi:UDP-3-O-acyl-N-acetylglucosamine deacetylase